MWSEEEVKKEEQERIVKKKKREGEEREKRKENQLKKSCEEERRISLVPQTFLQFCHNFASWWLMNSEVMDPVFYFYYSWVAT